MGKPSAPQAPDPYQTAGADYAYNNPSQYTPYGSLVNTPPTFQNTGTNRNPIMTQTGAGSMTMNLSPEIQRLFDSQLGVSQGTLSEALRRLPELGQLGPLPQFDRNHYEQDLFNKQKGLLDPVFADQERAMRDRLSNQGLAPTSEAYGYDQNQFQDNRNQQYGRAALDASLGAGDLMGQDISNTAAQRAIPFNEIASLLGLQQVQMPQLGSFQQGRGSDFTGAQALQSQMQQQNYQAGMGGFGSTLGGLFNLGGSLGSSAMMK
jgi:hypothetical protein